MRAYKLFIIYSFLQHHVSFKFNSEEVTRNERVSKFPSEKSERVGAFRRVVRHRERDATAKSGKERGRTTCGAARRGTTRHDTTPLSLAYCKRDAAHAVSVILHVGITRA